MAIERSNREKREARERQERGKRETREREKKRRSVVLATQQKTVSGHKKGNLTNSMFVV